MPIKIDCPRCKRSLSVPSKKAGGYVHCPECAGRFWVPADSEVSAPSADASPWADSPTPPSPAPPSPAPPSPAPPVQAQSPPSAASMRGAMPRGAMPVTSGQSIPMPAAPAAPPPASETTSEPKVARFIPAEAAQSKLEIAEDGQLPDLQLQEGDKKKMKKEDEENTERTVHPLVLFAVMCLSVVLSIAAFLYEPASPHQSSLGAKQEARRAIEEYYLAGVDDVPKPYQALLREALQAHARKNYAKERELYREVLRMLRAERPKGAKGPVGRPTSPEEPDPSDESLDGHLSTLLDDR